MKGLHSLKLPNPQKFKGMALGFLLMGMLAIVAWVSVDQLLAIQRRQSQIQETIGLERQVSQLRAHYLQANPDALDSDLQQAEQLLIQSFTHLAQWAQGLQEQGKQWDLLMRYRIVNKDRTASPIQGVTLVPLEIQVTPQGTQSAYGPFLQFFKALTRSGPKIEIRHVTVKGDGQKATHVTIGLSVWMKTIESVEL